MKKIFEGKVFKMKRRFLSILLSTVMVLTLLSGMCTMASATTVRDLSDFIEDSATPQTLGRWDGSGYTCTVTDGQNSSRIIAYSGTSTSSHVSLSIPQSAVNTNASAKPYILHLSYRIQNDRTNPAYITHRIQYKKSDNSGLYNDLFVTNTSQFTMNLDTSKNITTFGTSAYNYLDAYDYKVDFYKNLKTGAYQIYLNGVKWINAYDYSTAKTIYSGEGGSSAANTINEYRIRVTGAANSSWAFNLVNPCYEIYSEDVMMDDVVAYSLSGMSNYLNTTASTNKSVEINESKNITTVNRTETGYSLSGVSSGGYLRWWGITPGTNSSATLDIAWLHIGFDISSSSSVSTSFDIQWKTSNSTTKAANILGYSGTSYREDIYYDLSTNEFYRYKDNVFQGMDSIGYTNGISIKNIYFVFRGATSSCQLSNMVFEYYKEGVTPSDMLIGYDARSTTDPDYVYQISGIKTGTNVIGMVDGLCSVTGDNSSGYKLQPNSVNATNGGFARFYLAYTKDTGIFQRDTDRVLHQTFYYKPSAVTTEQTIGMRGAGASGTGGYKYFLYANPSTGNFENAYRNTVKPYNTNTWYKVDIIVNNKDFEYYFLLDGVCIEHGTLSWTPMWQTVFTSRSTSDYMHIKGLTTTLYKDDYTLLNKTTPELTRVYAESTAFSVAGTSASVTTSFIGPTANAGANTKILYGIYDSTGSLLKYQAVDSASGYINGSNRSDTISIPTGGTTLKVFMWNLNTGSNVLNMLSNAVTKSLQ